MTKTTAANILLREDACLTCPRNQECEGCTFNFDVSTEEFSQAVNLAVKALRSSTKADSRSGIVC